MSTVDAIGLVGVGLILVAYVLLQTERVRHDHPVYLLANALGAGLVLLTLAFDFNLSAAIIEGFWLLVSIYGLWRHRRRKKKTKSQSALEAALPDSDIAISGGQDSAVLGTEGPADHAAPTPTPGAPAP